MLAVFIERAARMQVLAQSIGKIKPIDPAFAREAHDYRLKPRAVAATFHYFARRALNQERDVLEYPRAGLCRLFRAQPNISSECLAERRDGFRHSPR